MFKLCIKIEEQSFIKILFTKFYQISVSCKPQKDLYIFYSSDLNSRSLSEIFDFNVCYIVTTFNFEKKALEMYINEKII